MISGYVSTLVVPTTPTMVKVTYAPCPVLGSIGAVPHAQPLSRLAPDSKGREMVESTIDGADAAAEQTMVMDLVAAAVVGLVNCTYRLDRGLTAAQIPARSVCMDGFGSIWVKHANGLLSRWCVGAGWLDYGPYTHGDNDTTAEGFGPFSLVLPSG